MIPLCLSAQLRVLEARYADLPLMQRAGAAAAAAALALLTPHAPGPVLVLAGPGNNGGDGLEAARLLRQHGIAVSVVCVTPPDQWPRDAAETYGRFCAEGGSLLPRIPDGVAWQLIIDALFGIGLKRPPSGPFEGLILEANRLHRSLPCPLLALDSPSGLNTDTGLAFEPTIEASHTLTFIADKPGLHTLDGPDYVGNLQVASLEIDVTPDDTSGALLSWDDIRPYLPHRKQNSHKGTNGSVAILGGSRSMYGAALMAGRAALHAGAGRVYLSLLDGAAVPYDPLQPEVMFKPPAELGTLSLQALACGPGLGSSVEALRWLDKALATEIPLLLDADALNLMAREGNLKVTRAQRSAPTLMTPHPMEAARLLECPVAHIQANRIDAALNLATEFDSYVALKGCGTVIATPDGQWWINPTGNPGMGTAGMGDILTGCIAALLAQGLGPLAALQAAVYLHGTAADQLVRAGHGPIGLTATETIPAIRRLINGIAPDPTIPG